MAGSTRSQVCSHGATAISCISISGHWKNGSRLNQAGFEIEQVRPYMRRNWVTTWDLLELAQMIQISKRRIAGIFWRKMPPEWLDKLAQKAAQIDLSAAAPGGGRLIVARKV
jgi:hypothetical protein